MRQSQVVHAECNVSIKEVTKGLTPSIHSFDSHNHGHVRVGKMHSVRILPTRCVMLTKHFHVTKDCIQGGMELRADTYMCSVGITYKITALFTICPWLQLKCFCPCCVRALVEGRPFKPSNTSALCTKNNLSLHSLAVLKSFISG